MAALVPKKTSPKEGSKVTKAKERGILTLKNKGLTNAAIGLRLGLKEDTVRKALKLMGWSQPKGAEDVELPLGQEITKVDPVEIRPVEQSAPEIEAKDSPKTSSIPDRQLPEKSEDPLDSGQISYDPNPSDLCGSGNGHEGGDERVRCREPLDGADEERLSHSPSRQMVRKGREQGKRTVKSVRLQG